MSLYSNIRESLSGQGLLKSGLGSLGSAASNALGGGSLVQAAVAGAQSMAGKAAAQLVNKAFPSTLRSVIDSSAGVIGKAMDGDWLGAGLAAAGNPALAGMFDDSGTSQMALRNAKTPLLGGGSLKNVQAIVEQVLNAGTAHKNLFIVEIASLGEGADYSELFNLFAVDVDYDPFNIAGDKQRVGGAMVDRVLGQEAVELRLTTFDNVAGDLKLFWERHHAAAVARDGTVGVPADYAIRIKLIHGITIAGDPIVPSYASEGLFRVATLSSSLSRREPALVELQMTFSQLDTFMRP